MFRVIALLTFSFLTGLSFSGCNENSRITFLENKAEPELPNVPIVPLTCDRSITTGYGGGSGTAIDPYTICSVEHWSHLGSDTSSWGKNFKLYSDIDFRV